MLQFVESPVVSNTAIIGTNPHPVPLPVGTGTIFVSSQESTMERELIDRAEAIQQRILQLRDSL